VKFNILEAEAVDWLKDLIREHEKWTDPSEQTTVLEVVRPRTKIGVVNGNAAVAVAKYK
jgi:hypothetical protein